MSRDVMIALDFKSAAEVFDFLDLFTLERPYVKVGMELFYAEGPQIVREIKKRGHKIFLDLKLHDIPNTVKKAMRVLSGLDVDMCNLHAAGTMEMMRAALAGLVREDGTRPLLIAVTQLTSTSEERMQKELLIGASMEDTVVQYAKNAKEAGLDGVVCSPLEAAMVKQACGSQFLAVTPGIRFADGAVGDQVRVTTPAKARESVRIILSWDGLLRQRRIQWPHTASVLRILSNSRKEQIDGNGKKNRKGSVIDWGGVSSPGRAFYLGERNQKPYLLR